MQIKRLDHIIGKVLRGGRDGTQSSPTPRCTCVSGACQLPNTLIPIISLDPHRDFLSFSEKASQSLFCRWGHHSCEAKTWPNLGQSPSLPIMNPVFPHLLMVPQPECAVMTRRCGVMPARWVLASYTAPSWSPLTTYWVCHLSKGLDLSGPQFLGFSICGMKIILALSSEGKRIKLYSLCRYLAQCLANIEDSASMVGKTLISHSSYFHVQGLQLHQHSWTLFPLLLTLPKGEEIYPSVHLEGYFGVCSQPCIRFIKGDSHSLRGCLWLDTLSWSENVLFWDAVLGHPLFPHPLAKCSNLTFISNRVDTLITTFLILTSIAELA